MANWIRTGACAAFAAAMAGCADPAVDAVVAWVEAIDDGRGVRKLQVYDRGERYALDIQPTVAGSGTEHLRIEVDTRGEGIAVSGKTVTQFVSLTTLRQPQLTRHDAEGQKLSESFRLLRNGDALLRGLEPDLTGMRLLMPTTSTHAGEVIVLEPPLTPMSSVLLEASDAPVLFWVEQVPEATAGPYAWGHVEAMIYPSEHGGGLPSVDEVRVLATGNVTALPSSEGAMEQRIGDAWCPGRTCVSPDGRSLVVLDDVVGGGPACSFEWWRWEDADPDDPEALVDPVIVEFEEVCPELSERWSLFAQLGHDTVALDDDDRVYVVDLATRTVQAGPKLWDNAGTVRLVDRGRAALLVSADSQVTRIDALGPRLLSTESHPCLGPAFDVVASGSGYWVARSCNGDGTFLPADTGKTLRLSPLGLEAYPGIPMRPLAIDDEGNVLLFSFDDDGDPRGLFVLGADGQVARIDPLEPQPDLVTDADGDKLFFAVQALRP
jgi:hypothetical protein